MSDFKSKYKKAIFNCYCNYVDQIGKLYDYYLISLEAIRLDYVHQKEENTPSFRVLQLFDSVYQGKTEKEMNDNLDKIKELEIDGKRKIKDVFESLEINFKTKAIGFKFNPKLKDPKRYHPFRARKLIKIHNDMIYTLETSILSSIISTFESFLSVIYSNLIYNNQSLYFEQRSVSFQKIFTNNINDIIDDETDKIVEKDMYDSIETIKKICEKEKIDFGYIASVFDQFKETYYRRNIYIHNDGIINNQYLSNVQDSKLKLGKKLLCGGKYFKNSIINSQKLMTYLFLKIIEKEELEEEEVDELLNIFFDRLANTEYELSAFAHKLISENKKYDFNIKMVAKVNYLISINELGLSKEFEYEMKTLDVTAAEDKFKIAKLVLDNKFDEASVLIEKNYKADSTPNELLNWPLFLHFRKTQFYKEIVSRHTKDFASEELTGDDSVGSQECFNTVG